MIDTDTGKTGKTKTEYRDENSHMNTPWCARTNLQIGDGILQVFCYLLMGQVPERNQRRDRLRFEVVFGTVLESLFYFGRTPKAMRVPCQQQGQRDHI